MIIQYSIMPFSGITSLRLYRGQVTIFQLNLRGIPLSALSAKRLYELDEPEGPGPRWKTRSQI